MTSKFRIGKNKMLKQEINLSIVFSIKFKRLFQVETQTIEIPKHIRAKFTKGAISSGANATKKAISLDTSIKYPVDGVMNASKNPNSLAS